MGEVYYIITNILQFEKLIDRLQYLLEVHSVYSYFYIISYKVTASSPAYQIISAYTRINCVWHANEGLV